MSAWVEMKNGSLGLICFLFLANCSTPPRGPISAQELGFDIREYVEIIDPSTNEELHWSAFMERVAEADIVLLGELHDHAVGHAVQLAVVQDVLHGWPQSSVAFEMLERDEQIYVDDYMDDIINTKTFTSLTNSASWAGDGSWVAWYQPIIETTKNAGGFVIAANAPRRYVRIARTDGFEKIDSLPPNRRRFVDYPHKLSTGRYRERFWKLALHTDDGVEEDVDVTTIDPDDPMLPVFKSQQVWDATMARSVALQKPTVKKKVVLLVGQFHIEYNGGVVQELTALLPRAKVLSVSIQKELPEEEWNGDPKIADLVIIGKDPKN